MPDNLTDKRVLIVGAGLAGVSAAIQLSQAGPQVHLLERQAHIGGKAINFGCKALDSCQKCNVCLALSKFRQLSQDPNIHLHLSSELTALTDAPANGTLRASLLHSPLPIDPAKCIACGLCATQCPAQAIHPAPSTLADTYYIIDQSKCLASKGQDCPKCQDICPTSAINTQAPSASRDLEVDAILLAIGYQPYDPLGQGTYGYGLIPNVITGLEAEQQLGKSATVVRPSDGQPPKNVAFIQCVGSRSEETAPQAFSGQYCSAICCAYAMRISRLLGWQLPGAKITIFYMDLQKFGKDYETLYNDCRDKVRLIRSRPSKLQPAADESVLLTYEDVSRTALKQEQFDLVVLSIGMRPPDHARRLADLLNIPVNEHGFLDPAGSARANIFTAGTCTGPADIAATIEQTAAVTARVLDTLCGVPLLSI